MNIGIYSIRGGKGGKELKQGLPKLMTELNRRQFHVLYTNDVENDPESLLRAVSATKTSSDNIDTVVVLGGNDQKSGGKLYNTLCQLCSPDFTPAKQYINSLNQEKSEADDAQPLQELKSNGQSRSNAVSLGDVGKGCEAYCFFYGKLRIVALPDSSASGVAAAEMIKEALDSASLRAPLPLDSLGEMGLGYEITQVIDGQNGKKKKKGGFIKSVIPMKGDRPAEVIRKLILIAASLTFIITAGFLINYLVIQPMLNDSMVDELRDTISTTEPRVPVNEQPTDADGEVDETPKSSKDWDSIKEINDEIAAWLTIPDTQIDYPVLYHEGDDIDDQYYLYKDVYGNYSGYGSLFIDYRSKGDVDAKNVIIHGHHMRDGRMFQNLMGYGIYSGDLDYYKEHPVIYFDTPEGDADWKIIAVYKTNTLDEHGEYFDYLTGSFNSDAEFMNYVYLIRERSLIDCPVDVNEDDQLLSLSTCSYEYSEFRTVVVARKCRPGESGDIDLDKARVNPDPLWPDVYYSSNGGTKPKVTSFSQAYEAGEIDWYDGEGDLKGYERAFTLHDAADAAAAQNRNSSSSSSSSSSSTIKEKSISFDYDELTLDSIGSTARLTVIWNPDNTSDKTLKWTTSNVAVADIDADGVVYAMGSGTAEITAQTKNGKVARCKVTVHQPVTEMSINYSGYDFYEGTSIQLTATVSPSNATDKSLTWSSSNPSVARVDQNGLVTGVSPGHAVITVKSSNNLTLTCEVNILDVP